MDKSWLMRLFKQWVSLLLFLFPLSIQAQSLMDPDANVTRAIVVGISDYQNPEIPDLNYAHKDAAAFADYLRSEGGGQVAPDNLILLQNEKATTGQFVAALSWLVEESQEGDRAIIYFSGHGDVERITKFQRGYLLTYDSPSNNYMAGGFPLFGLQDVVSTLSENGVEVTVIADACRAGKLAGSNVGGTSATTAAMSQAYGSETRILSCQPSEYSLEGEQWGGGRGVFSYFLIEGLLGLADENEDLIVDLFELENYLEDQIPKETAPQRQIPITVGDKSAIVADVNPEILDQLKTKKKIELPALSTIKSKGIEETVLSQADTSVVELYDRFKQALAEKQFLEPAGQSANYFFEQLVKEESIQPLHNLMRRNFASVLQEESQQAINNYLNTDLEELEDRSAKSDKYQKYPAYLEKAAELLGENHYLYNTLQARKLYFEGLNYRFAAKQNKEDLSLYQKAVQLQQQALQLDEEAAYVWNELGITIEKLGEIEESDRCLNKAIELAPTWSIPYYNFLVNYRDRGLYEEAEKFGLKALEIKPEDPDIYYFLAKLYKDQDRNEESLEMCYKYIELNPKDPEGYITIGRVLKRYPDRLDEAEQWHLKALEVDPNDSYSYRKLAELNKYYLERPEEAEKMFQKYVELEPNEVDGYHELARLYDHYLDRKEDAVQYYQRCIEMDSTYAYPYYNLAYMYSWKLDRLEDAVPLFEQYNQLEPDDPDGYFEIACIKAFQQQTAEALEWLTKAMERGFDETDRLKSEDRLKPLRDLPAFQSFLTR